MTDRRWRARPAVVVLSAVLALAGCRGEPAARPVAPPTSTAVQSSAAAAQNALDQLVRAAVAGDRPAFLAAVSTRDPAFTDRARLIYDNLSGLPFARLQARLVATSQPVSSARQQLLGTTSWRQQAIFSWRLTGETAMANATVWLTFVPGSDGARLAGTFDRPAGAPTAQPIWWTGPVTAVRRGEVTVLVGAGQPADRWLARTRAAVGDVRRRVTAGAAPGWSGAAVVEVPASRTDFEAVVGASPGSYARIAAVTLAEGSDTTAAVHVVVNPDVTRQLGDLGVATVLTHELVHVATRSADSPAPAWAVEGFADDVAFASHPGAEAASTRLLRDRVRQRGAPDTLPTDQQLEAGGGDLDLAYAEAWSVCRYVTRSWSPGAWQRLYVALDRGASLDRAAEDELGVSAAELTSGWSRWLADEAGG